MQTWEYRRTVLRQHEIADFIQSTKGDKYSALLPLLGLHPLEVAAENLRQLTMAIVEVSKVVANKRKLQEVNARQNEVFGKDTHDEILEKVARLHSKYCPDKAAAADPLVRCDVLRQAIDSRIAKSTAEQRRYIALRDGADLDLKPPISTVRDAISKLADIAESLITEKLQVLESVDAYAAKLGEDTGVDCPACGRSIAVDDFKAHLDAERTRLGGVIETFKSRKAAVATVCNTVSKLQSTLQKQDLQSWREELAKGPFKEKLEYLDTIDTERLRASCGEDELKAIERNLQPLIDAAIAASKVAPPDAQELATDKKTVEVATAILEAKETAAEVKRVEALVAFISSLSDGVREEIRLQAKRVVDDISADIQAMWTILHPGEPIDNVRLYLPPEVEKAIDIGLQFHGIEQDSPRLTLSEGYRNSLGLCIFLAMAQRESTTDRPVFLDDVVVSFDREHRGMIAEILEQSFGTRQVIILTHDRDWFTDLRFQLDNNAWNFKILLPYESPQSGIRWSDKTTSFDDARAFLKERPDAAGNDARKIMDVDLALITEKLQIKLPYVRGDKNDKRMANDFLERLIADGRKCFQKKVNSDYAIFQEGLDLLAVAKSLLVSWGNRASHGHDVVRSEAKKLIDACEKALECFRCSNSKCRKQVRFADAANQEWVQCQCGELRWRYGKG